MSRKSDLVTTKRDGLYEPIVHLLAQRVDELIEAVLADLGLADAHEVDGGAVRAAVEPIALDIIELLGRYPAELTRPRRPKDTP